MTSVGSHSPSVRKKEGNKDLMGRTNQEHNYVGSLNCNHDEQKQACFKFSCSHHINSIDCVTFNSNSYLLGSSFFSLSHSSAPSLPPPQKLKSMCISVYERLYHYYFQRKDNLFYIRKIWILNEHNTRRILAVYLNFLRRSEGIREKYTLNRQKMDINESNIEQREEY